MKQYVKPELYVDEFVPNTYRVAACSPDISQITTLQPQTAHCVIDGTENVFTSNCSGVSGSVYVYTYNGTTLTGRDASGGQVNLASGDYFVIWYTGNVTVHPNDTQQHNIDTLLAYANLVGHPGWHAGEVTPTTEIQVLINNS